MAPPASRPEAMIDKLPAELTNDVMSYLRPHDLTKLARASKRYREFAQSALWTNIELHRQDAHHDCFSLSNKKQPRAYLDDELRDPWSYRGHDGTDSDFDRHNTKFGTAIRRLYKTAGKSEAWDKIRNIRLRGYISTLFVSTICKASASSLVCLDLGVLDAPKVYNGDEDEDELTEEERGYPIYVRPRGALWYDASSWPQFTSLTHLLLCKPGPFDAPPDMTEEEDFETRDDPEHEAQELKQWASLLQAVRSTAVEIVLEHRPVYLDYLLDWDMNISPHDKIDTSPDPQFRQMVVKAAFAEEHWPNLEKLTFRCMATSGFDFSEVAEPKEFLQDFAAKMLPGVQVNQVPGNYMFFSTRKGTIRNQHGADGLKVHLEPNGKEDFHEFHMIF